MSAASVENDSSIAIAKVLSVPETTASSRLKQIKRGFAGVMVGWTIALAASLFWNVHQQSHTVLAELRAQVEAIHAMNMEYRNWIIHNGGVYVPVTDKTPPSPWLSHVPERDITTPSGKRLTLLNSSYALRMVQELMASSGAQVKMHISSLRPINPANGADSWEKRALEAFAKGASEMASVELLDDGKPYFRFMKPMVTDAYCLKCHAQHGDKQGDIRGGVSVSLPIETVLAAQHNEQLALGGGHIAIWALGLFGLLISSRRQQAAALSVEKSEAQVTLLTNSIAHAIYGLDLQGRCTFANDACLKMLGYRDKAELLGKNMHAVISHTRKDGTPYPSEANPILDTLRSGQPSHSDDEVFWRKDGGALPVAYWSYPVMLEGESQGAVVTFVDITEQLRLQKALKKSQSLLEAVVENIPAMVFLKRADDLRFELFNLAGEHLLGYSRAQLIGKNAYDLFPKEQADAFTQRDLAVLESHRLMDIPEEPIKVADGSEKWLHTFKVGLYDEANQPAYLLGISLDITDRKHAKDRLKESESKLAEAQRLAHLGHWERELATDRITCSEEVYRIFEIDTQRFAGTYQAFLQTIHPDDRAMVGATYAQSLKHRTPYQFEHRLRMPDGRVKYLHEKCETAYDEAGQAVRTLCTVQDVTTLKEAERALREHQKSLEETLEGTIHTVSMAVEVRDPYTAGHQRRVAELASRIAQKLGFEAERVHGVRLGAMIHDIGKIGVPAEILSKPTRLTQAEIQVIREHASIGYNILKDVHFPWPVADIAYQHHELLDGSGYPNGLKGEQILLEARIVAVADVVESMSSHRPYRPSLGLQAALDKIIHNRGILYDAQVVDACLEILKSGFKFD